MVTLKWVGKYGSQAKQLNILTVTNTKFMTFLVIFEAQADNPFFILVRSCYQLMTISEYHRFR